MHTDDIYALQRKVRETCIERLANRDAALYLGVTPHTLDTWRVNKTHLIPFLKIGSKVYYRVADLDTFLASRLVGA